MGGMTTEEVISNSGDRLAWTFVLALGKLGHQRAWWLKSQDIL